MQTRLSSLLHWLALAALLTFSQLSLAGVSVAGQEIGKATWADRKSLKASTFKVTENAGPKLKGGRVLRVEGPLVGKLAGSAELFYDANDMLAGARIQAPQPMEMLKRLAKASRARAEADNRYAAGDLRLRIVAAGGQDLLYITSAALDQQLAQSEAHENGPASWWMMSLWLAGGAVGLAIVWALGRAIWRGRAKIWMAREAWMDYVAVCTLAGVLAYAYPETRPGFQIIFGVYLLGGSLLLVWALRTVRHSAWLPRKPVVELLWLLPATPLLIAPAVLRNAFKSVHYAGMVLLFAQMLALVYYYFHPSLAGAVFWLAVAGLLGGGIARLYCAVFACFGRKQWHPAVRAALTLVLWPVYLAGFCVYFLFRTITGALVVALYLLIPAVLFYLGGEMTGTEWPKAVALLLPFLGLVPGVVGLFAMGTMSTGYSDLDFGGQSFNPATGLPMLGAFDSGGNAFGMGGFDFNPANGMPMMGGMGGFDAFGNTYGFSGNDPF